MQNRGVQPETQHIFTVPNMMTAARATAAVALPAYAATGGKYPTLVYGVAAASDMEGFFARLIDRFKPGWGTSDLGERVDPIADTALGVGGNAAILMSERSSSLAKVSAVISTVKVAKQAVWAVEANHVHETVFDEPYVKKSPSMTGKIGTCALFAGQGLALSTIELGDSGRHKKLRLVAGLASVGLSLTGLALGERARKHYATELQAKIRQHYTENSPSYFKPR